ncbi:hypothetical protein HC723_07510 [Vibrio sp. S11_S32]|uniref:Lar family restriction alleviation protein n=1 Tax=Vibrio sp. S11_S32 TaxID=2720225 RepID=UPI0016803743|nr:Lar family restriction alleviation protein [Vibrio sp. S11_S32]MBD1576280.1 hypothetical protein [Vibrio sp. S11_S32]
MSTFINVLYIKPCPKCSSKQVFCEQILDSNPGYYVACQDCNHEGMEAVKSHLAIQNWNHQK